MHTGSHVIQHCRLRSTQETTPNAGQSFSQSICRKKDSKSESTVPTEAIRRMIQAAVEIPSVALCEGLSTGAFSLLHESLPT
ncbi:hypothetical protein RvY_18194 [Ramazzottius varieornatus]|uniref:Uncharacterized protein n=1 Tax=Ramazzottius varieornatus TaxID=947166 RepID=A0A1D1W4U9_RAMVA|nr:hypothetical protein RvY_18194 [Ramazzottius varieornatus]